MNVEETQQALGALHAHLAAAAPGHRQRVHNMADELRAKLKDPLFLVAFALVGAEQSLAVAE